MRRKATALCALGLGMLVSAAPAFGASKNVEHLDQLPEAKFATAINFLTYTNAGRGNGKATGRESLDVMLVTGRFGLKSYSLEDPAHPKLLDEITAEELRLPGDPPVNFGSPQSTYWQNEDMDVDRKRKLAILSRDPRAYRGSTAREPGEPDPNGATNIAGFYVVDAKDPANLQLVTFQQLPTGHTTTCINDCQWLWTGGPASTERQKKELEWTGGRPIIVTDLRNYKRPVAYPNQPVDLFRRDGETAYAHDVQVDAMGIAWVSGDGGTRGYWTDGRHWDPVRGEFRQATPLDPVPYAGGGIDPAYTNDPNQPETGFEDHGGFMHNAARPVGDSAPAGDARWRDGRLLMMTEEDFGPAAEQCSKQGQFTIALLDGSYDGQAWRSTDKNEFRLDVVGNWNPFQKEGSRTAPTGFCSAHYFDVDGSLVTYAWYAEGTRFLDISDPTKPTQIAYWRPDDGNVWASYSYKGYVYTADANRGVDVLRLTPTASTAARRNREVVAPPMSKKQRRYLARFARQFKADPQTAGLCLLRAR